MQDSKIYIWKIFSFCTALGMCALGYSDYYVFENE
jgi:hypothetical protein